MQGNRYLEPHQARRRPPTTFEDLLGDAIERAFGSGVETLHELVACLNRSGPAAEHGAQWTPDNFQALMQRLANEGERA